MPRDNCYLVVCLEDEIRVALSSLNIVAATCYQNVFDSFPRNCQVVSSVSKLLQVGWDLMILLHVHPHCHYKQILNHTACICWLFDLVCERVLVVSFTCKPRPGEAGGAFLSRWASAAGTRQAILGRLNYWPQNKCSSTAHGHFSSSEFSSPKPVTKQHNWPASTSDIFHIMKR